MTGTDQERASHSPQAGKRRGRLMGPVPPLSVLFQPGISFSYHLALRSQKSTLFPQAPPHTQGSVWDLIEGVCWLFFFQLEINWRQLREKRNPYYHAAEITPASSFWAPGNVVDHRVERSIQWHGSRVVLNAPSPGRPPVFGGAGCCLLKMVSWG